MKKEKYSFIILLLFFLNQPGIAFSQDPDNTRECDAPTDLQLEAIYPGYFELTWTNPAGFEDQWLHWDDEVNYTAIGTGAPSEFDVAARWTPDQLSQYATGSLTAIAFFPDEQDAIYRVRVWEGAGAANMIADQQVISPVIGQWNEVELSEAIPIDETQELWVGYQVNTTTGYPAGCDDGPAIDGYGNMINFGGWQTLLQANPAMDYNWNIKALIESPDSTAAPLDFVIYRSENNDPYYIRAYSEIPFFMDDSALCLTGIAGHFYKVTARYNQGSDTCESAFSNETGFLCLYDVEENKEPAVQIHPNPARDLIQIKIRDDISMGISEGDVISTVKLLNSNGQIIFYKDINASLCQLPVADYPPGIYLLRVETGTGVVSRKVVVMR